MRLREDAAEWKALAERLEARRVLDVGAGLEGLPEEGEFDLIVAPNDPFAGILDDGSIEREVWRALGEHQYEIHTDGSSPARVRAWHCGESALRESGARIAGGLDERDFDPWGDRLIAVVPGWS